MNFNLLLSVLVLCGICQKNGHTSNARYHTYQFYRCNATGHNAHTCPSRLACTAPNNVSDNAERETVNKLIYQL